MKLTIRLVIACTCAAWHAAASAQSAERNDAIFLYRGADREQRLLQRARGEGNVVVYTPLPPTEAPALVRAVGERTGGRGGFAAASHEQEDEGPRDVGSAR